MRDKTFTAMALCLALCGLALFVIACADLGSNADASTTSVASTAVETETLVTEDVLFGTWDGTYTPTAAWDENGPIADPPMALGVPLGMHLELRPWSASSGDYGTASVGGFSEARVTTVFLDDQEVVLSLISEQRGLDDLGSVFMLTLNNGTLSGVDLGDPDVPSGWISSSADISLTRTALWEETAADISTTTETTSVADSEDAETAGAGDDDDVFVDLSLFMYAEILTTTTEPPARWDFHNEDDDDFVTVRIGDRVSVGLYFQLEDDVSRFVVSSTAPAILDLTEGRSDHGAVYLFCSWSGVTNALGDVTINILSLHGDGSLHEMWQLHVEVTE